MSTIDTSTWNPDPALNESIGDIPLNESASIKQTWQAIQMLMAAGGLHGLQLVTFEGATASADGKQGLVPAPQAGDQDNVLKGDGTWGTLSASDIPNIDASKITSGTIDLARLPAGALERLVAVADQTARFALTTASVQLGDTVKQLDTGVMYIVVDTSKLGQADGYVEFTAGSATSVPWSGVTGKPSSYTPSSHTHGSVTNDGKLGTASRVVVTDGSKAIGVSSVTSTELGYLSGVTSAVQTQIDAKMLRGSYERIQGTSSEHSDLNNYTSAGFYNVKTQYVDNCPSGIGKDAVLLVYPWNTANYLTQELTESAASNDVRRWLRKLNSGSWSSWKQVAFSSTTLAGYGITDAKIASGVITLGSDTITPLTSSSSLDASNLTGTASVNTTGNAATATKLATPVTINGVSFDGSANITVADSTKVAKAGDTMTGDLTISSTSPNLFLQNTLIERGTAPSSYKSSIEIQGKDKNNKNAWALYHTYATDKTHRIRLLCYNGLTTDNTYAEIGVGYDSDGNPYTNAPTPSSTTDNTTKIATTAWVRTATGNFACNAVTATKLATARTINGVAFDGSADIVVEDSAKLPAAGGAMTGEIVSSSGLVARRDDTAHVLTLYGGTEADNGARLELYGGTRSTNPGAFALTASIDSSTVTQLLGKPDGTLTWGGQPIQTSSDERLKTPLSFVPDAVLDAWEAVQWGQFQFLEAVERKGASARLHLGLIAQRVKSVFEERSLDACDYGILCYEQEEDMWTVRYAEALAMEAVCQRRRADRLEARVKALEEAMR